MTWFVIYFLVITAIGNLIEDTDFIRNIFDHSDKDDIL